MTGAGGGGSRTGPRPATPDAPAAPRLSGRVLLVLGAAWLGFMLWFVWTPLPSASSASPSGAILRRALFVLEAFPGLAVGPRSIFGNAFAELAGLDRIGDRAPIIAAAGLIALAACGMGALILRIARIGADLGPWERPALQFALGQSAVSIVTLMLGRMGLLSPLAVRALLAIAALGWAIAKVREIRRRLRSPARAAGRLGVTLALGAITGLWIAILSLAAMTPTIEYDALSYHLLGPKEYFLNHRITFLEHNVYTSMPFQVEMGHLAGMYVLNDWRSGALAGQLLIALSAPATAVLVAATARRRATPFAGAAAGFIYLSTPWVARVSTYPFVEGPLCLYHAALVWSAVRAFERDEDSRVGFDFVMGLCAGGAFACKYPALVSAGAPLLCLSCFRSAKVRSLKPIIAATAGALLIAGPWLIKNVMDTGNPVYPLAYQQFGGTAWDAALDQKWRQAHGPRPGSPALFALSLADFLGRSDWQSSAYVLLAPLAWLIPAVRRFASFVALAIVWIFLTWWLLTHRLERFWLPALPPAAVLAGIGADALRIRGGRIAALVVLSSSLALNVIIGVTELTIPHGWTTPLRVLQAKVQGTFSEPLNRLEAETPKDARVLVIGQASLFYLNRDVAYNTAFSRDRLESIARGRTPREIGAELKRLKIDFIYVDWQEIARYRSPGNYGYTDFITHRLFAELVRSRVLSEPKSAGPEQELYRVIESSPGGAGRLAK